MIRVNNSYSIDILEEIYSSKYLCFSGKNNSAGLINLVSWYEGNEMTLTHKSVSYSVLNSQENCFTVDARESGVALDEKAERNTQVHTLSN